MSLLASTAWVVGVATPPSSTVTNAGVAVMTVTALPVDGVSTIVTIELNGYVCPSVTH